VLAFNLDALGWCDFELLVQSLLKRFLGLGIEAWGGRSDWGRDAYAEGPLAFPSDVLTDGPFIFQCKFVENASASGAKPFRALSTACDRELDRIGSRTAATNRQDRNSQSRWSTPSHFALYTNAPLTGRQREELRVKIKSQLRQCAVTIHDGNDICSSLLGAPELARPFPQILSLRDLEGLFREWVTPEISTRSAATILQAQEISQVFVPTRAYFDAISKLLNHKFVVLEGPPEVGKTAIGRMIGMAQLALSWEVIECKRPQEMLARFRKERQQVFIGDDFFGRTEYDPSRISDWQEELPNILSHLDRNHWLILTTRAHLLAIAKRTLDVAGANHRFPDLGEVVVDAGQLTEPEKARILYRHAKRLPVFLKEVIKGEAQSIVDDSHFTPHRIRLLASDLTIRSKNEHITHAAAIALVHDVLTNPTKEMRTSFRSLTAPHKWLLFAMLEADDGRVHPRAGSADDLPERYERLCPPDELEDCFLIAQELSESFVTRLSEGRAMRLDWMHPSCRDLAIDELAQSPRDRQHFLRHCDRRGVHLATSIGGGSGGSRTFPLLTGQAELSILRERVLCLLKSDLTVVDVLHGNLEAAKREGISSPITAGLVDFIRDQVLPIWSQRLVDTGKWSPYLVSLYVGSSRLVGAPINLPELTNLARDELMSLKQAIRRAQSIGIVYGTLRELIDLAELATASTRDIEALGGCVKESIFLLESWIIDNDAFTKDESENPTGAAIECDFLRTEILRINSLAWLDAQTRERATRLARDIRDRSRSLEDYESEIEDRQLEPGHSHSACAEDRFSVAELFRDL
jgi:hypothetical protein